MQELDYYLDKYVLYKMDKEGENYYKDDNSVWEGFHKITSIKYNTRYPLTLNIISNRYGLVAIGIEEIICKFDRDCKIVKLIL